MLRISGGPGTRGPRRGGPDPRRLRLFALVGVVAVAVVLPLTASAGQVGDAARSAGERAWDGAHAPEHDAADAPARGGDAAVRGDDAAVRDDDAAVREGGSSARDDAKRSSAAPGRSPLVLGLGLATAARCGPELSSPDGIEAQTCVLTQGEDTWARTYYRNTSGDALDSTLSLMGPGGRTVQTHCVTGADDEPATCETPRENNQGEPGGYTAVSEFAARGTDGPLLLRSGSNS